MFEPAAMQRASTLLRTLPLPADTINSEDLARKAWASAVGKKIAGHARAIRMVRTRLVVEVEDPVWKRQLLALTGQILSNLAKKMGPGLVEDIEFRVVPPRREPHRAARIAPALELVPDEADSISDPVLRTIYKAARKKALA